MGRETGNVSVCVPSLLESAIVFDTCVTVCMCVYVCVCVCACNVSTAGQSYGIHLAICAYVQSVCV